jgi:hypothetical protein
VTTVTYTSSGTFTVPAGVTTLDHVFIVAGGASGGRSVNGGGGGGAGGCVHLTNVSVTPSAVLTVTVGAGGAAKTGTDGNGNNGSASVFDATSVGGGGGGAGVNVVGVAGGSGGGGAPGTAGVNHAGGAGTSGEGSTGGAGFGSGTVANRAAGGGGGKGAVGGSASTANGGAGGAGVDWSSWLGTGVGVAGWFGGGGGGAKTGTGSPAGGGQGGGGAASSRATPALAAVAGTANTGGGGGGGAGHVTTGQTDSAAGGSGFVAVIYTPPAAPNVPTSLDADAHATSIDFSWLPPSGGGPVDSYDVRIDGGTPDTGATSPHTFTGLTAVTSYTLEVRAVGPGGTSSWATLGASTATTGPDVDYAALVRIGSHFWDVEYGDPLADDGDPEVLAGVNFTWTAPNTVGWPPPQWTVDRDVCTLAVRVPTAADVADVRKGDVVRFKFTPLGYDYDAPLVDFAGVITADPNITDDHTGGVTLQVTASDYRVLLTNFTVPGMTLIGTNGVTTTDDALIALSAAIDTLADGQFPGGFGDVTVGAVDPRGALAGVLDHDVNVPADGRATAMALFASIGMVPVPQYDDDGDLDPVQPFRIVEPDPYGADYDTPDPVSSCLVPNSSVNWRRDTTPTAVEYPPSLDGYLWAGGTAGDLAHAALLRLTSLADFNEAGFSNELAEADPWTLHTFTVDAWQDPEAVRGWFTYPDRVRQYVTLDEVELIKAPSGTDTVAGMLRGASLTASGATWTVDAGLRAHHFNII